MIPLRPLNPLLHPAYTAVLEPPIGRRDTLPPDVRASVRSLLERRNSADEAALDAIDRELVATLWWHALRPDTIARRVLQAHHIPRRRPLSVEQATLIVAALGEAGYPVHFGVPEYRLPFRPPSPPPVRGPERDDIVWAAARYWAARAGHRYISFGDRRGWLPRPVQYDESGTLHPLQRASLTLGPVTDWTGTSHDYVRAHTRLLLLVEAGTGG
jgi:hypothetical protein